MNNAKGIGICANNVGICHYQIAKQSADPAERQRHFQLARTHFDEGCGTARASGASNQLLARLSNYMIMLLEGDPQGLAYGSWI